MKSTAPAVACLAALLVAASGPAAAAGTRLVRKTDDLSEVLTLIEQLKATVEADGKMEQKSYDKYACWCEQTFERKAKEIEEVKNKISELTNLKIKLKGELAAHTAEIKQLEKDIAECTSSMSQATTVRQEGAVAYQADKIELEQCIGALESAINVLSGAGGKKAFLGTLQEAQLLSSAVRLKDLLGMSLVTSSFSEAQLREVQKFAENPDSFVHRRTDVSDLQTDFSQESSNPDGDYSPASTQIQGILKGMYDSFAEALEKANAEEGSAQSTYEELLSVKQRELDTLNGRLTKETGLQAEKNTLFAETKAMLNDLKAQLKADEHLLAEITLSCREKARQWAQRSHLRSEELAGIMKAIEILGSKGAKSKYSAAKESFMQLGATRVQRARELVAAEPRNRVFASLSKIASRFRSVGLAQVAATVKTGGQFDRIIAQIDKMIAELRAEEANDIYHKDRCEAGMAKNKDSNEDLANRIAKREAQLEHHTDNEKDLEKQIEEVEGEIEKVNGEMKDRLKLRNDEEADFKKSLRDDAAAIEVLGKGIDALTAFYKANGLPLELVQDPEYTIDKDKAPEVSWDKEGGNYGGKKTQSNNIITILTVLKEDLEMEMKTAKKDDAEAEEKYETDYRALLSSKKALEASKVTLDNSLSGLQNTIGELEEVLEQRKVDLKDVEDMKKALDVDCAWVELTFDKRMKARKEEVDGLMEAKNVLAGASSGDDL